jgi:hypothetical protein
MSTIDAIGAAAVILIAILSAYLKGRDDGRQP